MHGEIHVRLEYRLETVCATVTEGAGRFYYSIDG